MTNADGSIVISADIDASKADKKLEKFKKNIENTEKSISETQGKRDEANQRAVFSKQKLDEENAKLTEMKETLREIQFAAKNTELSPERRIEARAQLPIAQDQIKEQQTVVRALQSEYNQLLKSVDKYDQSLADSRQRLEEQKNEAGMLVKQINEASSSSNGMGDAIDRAAGYMEKFVSRVKRLMSRVFVFTLITSALRGMRTWLWNVIKTNDEATSALAKLKGALLTLAQPIIEVVIPAFIALINLLTKLINMAASLVSKLFGKTAKQSAAAAKNLYEEQNALKDVGSAAEEATESLAGFDEINTIQTENQGGAGGGFDETTTGIKPDFSGIGESLSEIAMLFTGAALLALGAILTFTGANIPLGIALMALGASALYSAVTSDPQAVVTALRGPLGIVLAALSYAFLAIGAILAFSGANIALGIALMIMGAAGLSTVAAVNWDTIVTALQGPIGAIVAYVSGELLLLGAVLLFSGAAIPLGIGLLIVGAAGLATTAAVNWNSIVSALQGPIGVITGIVGAALLILGIILLFTGAGIPLGIGLIIAGSAGLAAAIAPNWNWLVEKLKGVVGSIKQYVINPLVDAFKWLYNGVVGIIEGIINGFTGIINGFIRGINFVIGTINKIPGVNLGTIGTLGTVSIPRLAQGAVIPPNREFMAVLGDQKSGTNVEAPLSTIKQALIEALAESGGGSNRPIQVTVTLDKKVLGRVLVDQVNDMTRAAGKPVLIY